MTKVTNRAPVFRKKDSKQPYFEGYYFKFINKQKEIVIIIAGISISKSEKYSFIQVASNYSEKVSFFKFPLSELTAAEDRFEFKIGQNFFSKNRISFDLGDINGEVSLANNVNWKRSFLNPNIMGFLSFIPRVECKHDVITINTDVLGEINLSKQQIQFDEGDGYIEKNWGSSFPNKYMWLHANQFKNKELSLQFAIAKPKWLFFRPQVYIGYVMNGKLIHFATHRLSWAKIQTHKSHTSVKIHKLRRTILIKIKNDSPVNLIGPKKGSLNSSIDEYLKSDIELIISKNVLLGKNIEIIRDTSVLSTTEMHNETHQNQPVDL